MSHHLLCSLTHGLSNVGRPARTYRHQLWAETGFNGDDRSVVMDKKGRMMREIERERERGFVNALLSVLADYIYIYI